MSGLDARTDGLTQGGVYQHHLTGAGEFSTGEMGNFQPALTFRKFSFPWCSQILRGTWYTRPRGWLGASMRG